MNENAQIWLKMLAEHEREREVLFAYNGVTIPALVLPQATESIELTEQDKQWLKELKVAL